MQTDHYPNRAKELISKGVKTGAILGFFSSLIYTALLFLMVFSTTVFAPQSPHYESAVSGSFIIGGILCTATVLPSTIIGIVGGIVVASILALWKQRIANIWASLVGFVVGTTIISIVNYFIWQTYYTGVNAPHSFAEYLFPSNTDLVSFLMDQNPFFIPSVIAVLLSTIGARQINKQVLLEQGAG
jgi:hypothetical protein